MSHYSYGAIKLSNGPNERIKTNVFSWLDFGFKDPVKHILGHLKVSKIPGWTPAIEDPDKSFKVNYATFDGAISSNEKRFQQL